MNVNPEVQHGSNLLCCHVLNLSCLVLFLKQAHIQVNLEISKKVEYKNYILQHTKLGGIVLLMICFDDESKQRHGIGSQI